MIELKDLSAGYYGEPVLHHITLDFKPGELLAIVGPNGSGKSTLLKAALGLLEAQTGQVLYDGSDLTALSRKEAAQKAAYLTQSRPTPAIPALNLVLHGRFPHLSYPRRYSREDYAIARRALSATDSLDHARTNVQDLSGGQRQGVYLAMTLAQQADTVFLDEPTTFLDIRRQHQIMDTAQDLAREGKAVAAVLHDIPLALTTAHRVAVLDGGRLAAWDTPEAVFASGVLDRVFGVVFQKMDTKDGTKYYVTTQKER